MNTSRIKRTKTTHLPYFPVLPKTRIITKHFTNLCLTLPADQYCLLTWLIFNCGQDNLIKYRTFLLRRYLATLILEDVLKTKRKLVHRQNRSLQAIRGTLQALILQGYILSSGTSTGSVTAGKLLLNPLLTYSSHYITKKQYKEVCEMYQRTGGDENTPADEIIKHWLSIVNN